MKIPRPTPRLAPPATKGAPNSARKKCASELSGEVPAGLIESIVSLKPNLALESPRHQRAVVQFIHRLSMSSRRDHRTHLGAKWATVEELRKVFGRNQFEEVNDRLQFCHCNQYHSAANRRTFAYVLSPRWLSAHDHALWQLVQSTQEKLPLLAPSKIGPAISSKAASGRTTQVWGARHLAGAKLNALVPVNQNSLRWLISRCQQAVSEPEAREWFATRVGRFRSADELQSKIQSRLRAAQSVLLGARRLQEGADLVLPTQYVESASGRLYARGTSLQNVPRVVRIAPGVKLSVVSSFPSWMMETEDNVSHEETTAYERV